MMIAQGRTDRKPDRSLRVAALFICVIKNANCFSDIYDEEKNTRAALALRREAFGFERGHGKPKNDVEVRALC